MAGLPLNTKFLHAAGSCTTCINADLISNLYAGRLLQAGSPTAADQGTNSAGVQSCKLGDGHYCYLTGGGSAYLPVGMDGVSTHVAVPVEHEGLVCRRDV